MALGPRGSPGLSSASRAKRHPGVGPSAQTLGITENRLTTLDGVFSLRTPRDLREKLESDYLRLAAASPDSVEAHYAAFDFFVTAEHLADWQSRSSGASITSLRKYPEGPLVSHIANGAKHFRVTDARHTTVRDTTVQFSGFQPGAFQPDAFPVVPVLCIELESGSVEAVLSVAQRVLEHWRAVLP